MIEAEERPVADRLEGVDLPAECPRVMGHDDALDHVVKSYHSGRMHHAWLISGPRGIGKATLAFTLAKHILSHPDGSKAPDKFSAESLNPNVVRQIAHGAHPELLHLTRPWDAKSKKFKTQLSVEEVRRTLSFYGMTAGAGGWRITIVDAADDMNASAANALLKVLEEPPKRSIFFVLTHAAGGLLPTIRSRCQSLPLCALKSDDLVFVLRQLGISASRENETLAVNMSEGSPRRAIQLLNSKVLGEFESFGALMQARARGSAQDWTTAHKIANTISRKGQEETYDLFLDLVTAWLGRQVREQAGQGATAVARWADIWENCRESQTLADAFNLDRKQVILSLFARLFASNAESS